MQNSNIAPKIRQITNLWTAEFQPHTSMNSSLFNKGCVIYKIIIIIIKDKQPLIGFLETNQTIIENKL